MSNPSISDIVKNTLRESTSTERDWWNKQGTEAKRNILIGKDYDFTEIASENAYQQETTAKFNQLVNTSYDSLPRSVKAIIKESLIDMGELPNPSDFKGIGNEFVANPWGITKEVFTECDRCDETFMDEDDYQNHKDIDHGDDGEDFDKVEETYALSMNPDLTREKLREARRIINETSNDDFHRSVYFNGKDLPQATVTEPDDVKGIKGYNDNPNKGLYDNKLFKSGTSKDRVALESHSDNESEPTQLTAEPYDGDYDTTPTLAGTHLVNVPSATDKPIGALEGVDFSEESIDYVYPTKATEAFVEEEDPFIDGYSDDDIDSDKDAVEAQIISRKLHGYGAETIARELVMQYGVSMDEAIEKANAVEVNTNDRVANTFFGKRYNECTTAEINELKLYGGSE
jgi:hypothetical protein